MAKQSDNEHVFHPKHRIVGAIIIVSLAVIFLPMILQDDPDFTDEKVRLESVPDKKTKNKEYVVKVKPGSNVAATQVKPNTDQSKAPKRLPTRKRAKAGPRADKPTTSKPRPKAAAGKGWMVQVGTFTNRKNVDRVSRKLRQAGFKVDLSDADIGGKKATRIRVGPYGKKEMAKQQLARINAVIGLEGIVVSNP